MKLVVITGAIHFDEQIEKILDKSGVGIYSRSNISGHRKGEESDLSESWFAVSNGYQDSVMFFAFTPKENAKQVMDTVNAFNETLTSNSPIRVFILSVDNHNL
ncbi:MAG: hypothetical protein R2788_02435 [Saprospiraceae bacterium]